MARLRWTEAMSVGLPELDADHKELIRVINQLEVSAAAGDRQPTVRQCLYALLRYAEFHFAREEKVMAACGHPGIAEHKRGHRAFVNRMYDLNSRFDNNPNNSADVVNEALLQYLQDWWNHHILIEDKAYKAAAERSPEARQFAKSFKAIEIWWSG